MFSIREQSHILRDNSMRVNLIKEQTIRNFSRNHAASREAFEKWIYTLRNADWKTPDDMKYTFNHVDFLGKNSHRVVFDVAGNSYRVICKYYFGTHNVFLFVCWIGTHATYSSLCKKGEQYTSENFQNYI